MVNLPKDIIAESLPEETVFILYQNNIFYAHKGVMELKDLEYISTKATNYTSLHERTWNPHVYQTAMNKLRQIRNMVSNEFKMRCSECGTAHYEDEILAPER
ncbi:unnamed protein product, partial [Brenthis ino]